MQPDKPLLPSVVLFDHLQRENLLPLALNKPVAEFRFGILTMRQKWERMLPGNYSYWTAEYLMHKYPINKQCEEHLYVAANIVPSMMLCAEIMHLNEGEALFLRDRLIAYKGKHANFISSQFAVKKESESDLLCFDLLYDLFRYNGQVIEEDYRMLVDGRKSEPLSDSVRIIGDATYADGMPKVFLEEGVSIECVTLNVKDGPIYLGKDVEIQEGSAIRGPFAACEHAVVNMNSKIYGATTLGPFVKVGGELNNVLFFGFSNKAHDGFLGNAVIGEWCNLGAGTNASNLKNDYSEIKLWNYPAGRFLKTGLQFCGLIMGDHSKVGINGMLNTATVLGVGVNIHGSGFPRNFVPSFSEGGTAGFSDVSLVKFFRVAALVMERRGQVLTDQDRAIFEHIYNNADGFK